jgi:hypothetical protein
MFPAENPGKLDASLIEAYLSIHEGGVKRGHAAGATDIQKQASQLASDIKYKAKGKVKPGANKEEIKKVYMALLASSPAGAPVKALAKKKLIGEEVQVVSEEESDRMRDRELEDRGMGARDRGESKPSNTSMKKKPKKGGLSALELVKRETEKKYGKGSIMGREKEEKEDKDEMKEEMTTSQDFKTGTTRPPSAPQLPAPSASTKKPLPKPVPRTHKPNPMGYAIKGNEFRVEDAEMEGENLDEKTLTKGEMKKKEEIVKSMKKKAGDFEKRYPGRGKEVMYATATKMAKKVAEGLDPVGQEDSDIDNDGDTDKSDKYLGKRRNAIKKAIQKRRMKEGFSNWRNDLSFGEEVKK